MRIGFYFRADHFSEWNLTDPFNRHLAMSGTDRSMLWLARSLSDQGRDLTLFSNHPPASGWSRSCQRAASFAQAVELASDAACDLFLSHNQGDDATLPAVRAAEGRKLPVILWDHNGPTRALAEICAECESVKALVCVSNAQADGARHHAVFKKISVVPNPIDLEFWTAGVQPRETGMIVYLGSLTPAKSFHQLAKVWPSVRRQFPAARLHVCGSGRLYERGARLGPLGVADEAYERQGIMPHLGATRQQAAQLGVTFEGLTQPETTRALLQRCAFGVVNPGTKTSWETFCVSAVEMQACGAPVVGGRAGGLLETVQHGSTGLLVRDEQELEKALGRLLAETALRERMSAAAPQHVRQFAPGLVLEKWQRILYSVYHRESLPVPGFAARPFCLKRYLKRFVQLLGAPAVRR